MCNTKNCASLLATCFFGLLCCSAWASISGPGTDDDGDYYITWNISCSSSNNGQLHLYENGMQVAIGSCGIAGSYHAMAKTPDTTYNYLMDYCQEFYPEPGLLCDSDFGANEGTTTVTVLGGGGGTGPIRIGDYDSDGKTDLFIDDSTVSAPYILRQNPDNTFQLVANLNSSQIQYYRSNWPDGAATITLLDLNLDEAPDMIIKGVSGIVPGADDQIVFAGAQSTQPPIHVKAIDADVRAFFDEAAGVMLNPFYLEQKMYDNGWLSVVYWGTQTRWFWAIELLFFGQTYVDPETYIIWNYVDDTSDAGNINKYPTVCYVLGYVNCDFNSGQWRFYTTEVYYEVIWDTSHLNQTAVDLWDLMQIPEQTGELVAGDSATYGVSYLFDNLFGVPFMGGVLENPGTSLNHEADLPDDWRRKARLSAIRDMLVAGDYVINEKNKNAVKDALEDYYGSKNLSIADRIAVYNEMHQAILTSSVAKKSKWFKAAAEVNDEAIETGLDWSQLFGVWDTNYPFSANARAYLDYVGNRLLREANVQNFASLMVGDNPPGTGSLSGEQLDDKLVEIEQSHVSEFTNDYFGSDAATRASVTSEINSVMNLSRQGGQYLPGFGPEVVYEALHEEFGSEAIDFGNEEHRNRLGKKIVAILYGSN